MPTETMTPLVTPLDRDWAERRAQENALNGVWTDPPLFKAFDTTLAAAGVLPGSAAYDVAVKALKDALAITRTPEGA